MKVLSHSDVRRNKDSKLKPILFFLTLLFVVLAIGQPRPAGQSIVSFSQPPELTVITQIPDSVFEHRFVKTIGVDCSDMFELHKNNSFDFYSCGYKDYGGKWKISNKNVCEFRSSNKNLEKFYIVTFKQYYYLVPETKLNSLIQRFSTLKEKHKNDKPVVLHNITFTADDNIAIELATGIYWITWL